MRYNFDNGVMFAAIDGRWVKWEDHAKIVKELAHETKLSAACAKQITTLTAEREEASALLKDCREQLEIGQLYTTVSEFLARG